MHRKQVSGAGSTFGSSVAVGALNPPRRWQPARAICCTTATTSRPLIIAVSFARTARPETLQLLLLLLLTACAADGELGLLLLLLLTACDADASLACCR